MIHVALFVLFLYPALTISGQIARMIMVAMCLLCCHPSITKKLREPGRLLLTWFVWACICSYYSDNFGMSLFGYHKRWEGLSTWALAISFAWLFWRSSNLNKLFLSCAAILVICFGTMIFYPDIARYVIYGHIAIAGFVTVISCMLVVKHPIYVCSMFPFLYLTQNRSMIIGLVFAGIAYAIIHYKMINKTYVTVFGLLIFLVSLIAYPKLSKINPSTFGKGARIETIKQAMHYTILSPIIGYGIDTQSTLLKQSDDSLMLEQKNKMADGKVFNIIHDVDRCHNFFFDILMQTGVIGLVLWLFLLTRMVYRTFCYPSEINQACLLGVAAWLGFGMLNPTGIPAIFMACVCIMGIEKMHYENIN